MKKLIFSLIILSTFILSGCTTGSTIVTGNIRPEILPTEVQIFTEAPADYEVIGMIDAATEVAFSSQTAQDRTIKKLKDQAAKLGANGVLIIETELDWAGLKTTTAKAIYIK